MNPNKCTKVRLEMEMKYNPEALICKICYAEENWEFCGKLNYKNPNLVETYTPADYPNLPEPEWFIPDLIPKSQIIMLGSREKVGKSFLAFQIMKAFLMPSYKLFYHYDVKEGGNVLHLDEEMGEPENKRRARMQWEGFADGHPEGIQYKYHQAIKKHLKLDDDRKFRQIIDLIHAWTPALLIIDSLRTHHTGSEGGPWYQMVWERIHALRDEGRKYGMSLLILHHYNKKGEYRGGTEAGASPDIIFYLQKGKTTRDEETGTITTLLKFGSNGFRPGKEIGPFWIARIEFLSEKRMVFGYVSEVTEEDKEVEKISKEYREQGLLNHMYRILDEYPDGLSGTQFREKCRAEMKIGKPTFYELLEQGVVLLRWTKEKGMLHNSDLYKTIKQDLPKPEPVNEQLVM